MYDVEERIAAIKSSIAKKSMAEVAEIMIKDSNAFHAVCLDTYPPILYMNPTSKFVIDSVHMLNDVLKLPVELSVPQ